MKLIQRVKIWKELRRLEQRAKAEPSPSTFVDLGQVYINLGLHEKAERMAEDGLALFPRSTELRDLLDRVRRGARTRRAAQLRKRLERAPTAKRFRELAALYVELDDTRALHLLCQEWSVRFPDDPSCWLVLGQARLSNFYRDLASREGREAVECLERAVEIAPHDQQPRRLLGEVLYRVGAVGDAQEHLRALRELTPRDEELAQLLRYVAGLPDSGGDLGALLEEVEARGSLRHEAPQAPAPVGQDRGAATAARAGLARVGSLPGVEKAAFIRGSKAMVRGSIEDGRDPFLRIVRVAAKAAHRFARRLDLGSAAKTVLEGDFGRICVCVYGEALAAAEVRADADVEAVLAGLQEIVAGALHAVEA